MAARRAYELLENMQFAYSDAPRPTPDNNPNAPDNNLKTAQAQAAADLTPPRPGGRPQPNRRSLNEVNTKVSLEDAQNHVQSILSNGTISAQSKAEQCFGWMNLIEKPEDRKTLAADILKNAKEDGTRASFILEIANKGSQDDKNWIAQEKEGLASLKGANLTGVAKEGVAQLAMLVDVRDSQWPPNVKLKDAHYGHALDGVIAPGLDTTAVKPGNIDLSNTDIRTGEAKLQDIPKVIAALGHGVPLEKTDFRPADPHGNTLSLENAKTGLAGSPEENLKNALTNGVTHPIDLQANTAKQGIAKPGAMGMSMGLGSGPTPGAGLGV